jgi:hypothetical protein
MIRPGFVLLLAATPAAQRGGCGFGLGHDALCGAEAALRRGAATGSLPARLDAAGAAADRLADATARLADCDCGQPAEHARDAIGLAG